MLPSKQRLPQALNIAVQTIMAANRCENSAWTAVRLDGGLYGILRSGPLRIFLHRPLKARQRDATQARIPGMPSLCVKHVVRAPLNLHHKNSEICALKAKAARQCHPRLRSPRKERRTQLPTRPHHKRNAVRTRRMPSMTASRAGNLRAARENDRHDVKHVAQ